MSHTRAIRSFFRRAPVRIVPVVALLVAPLSAVSVAHGDPRPAKADRLFADGLKFAQGGDCTRARERFVESYAADPAPGTLVNWALCEEKLGRAGSALELFKIADQRLPPNHPKRASVTKHIDALTRRVPFLRLRASAEWPAGASIVQDGVLVDPDSLGQTQPGDAGPHIINVRAPGRRDRRYEVILVEGRTLELTVEPGAALDAAGARQASTPSPPAAPNASARSSDRFVGWAFVGGGVAAIGVGAFTGFLAQARWNDVRRQCEVDTKLCQTQDAIEDAHAGRALSTVSTAAFAFGGLGLAIGSYLLVANHDRPSKTEVAPLAGPGLVGLHLRGGF